MSRPLVIDAHCHAGDGRRAHRAVGHRRLAATATVRRAARRRHRPHGAARPADLGLRASEPRDRPRSCGPSPGGYLGFAFVNPARDRGRIGEHGRRGRAPGVSAGSRCTGTTAGSPARSPRSPGAVRLPVLYDPRGDTAPSRWWPAPTPTSPGSSRTCRRSPTTGRRRSRSSTSSSGSPTSSPTPPGCATSTCWPTRCAGPGRDKVLFGSDGPFLHPGVELAKVHALRLPPDEAALVLGGNLLRLTRAARPEQASSSKRRST